MQLNYNNGESFGERRNYTFKLSNSFKQQKERQNNCIFGTCSTQRIGVHISLYPVEISTSSMIYTTNATPFGACVQLDDHGGTWAKMQVT